MRYIKNLKNFGASAPDYNDLNLCSILMTACVALNYVIKLITWMKLQRDGDDEKG